jgi:hypothetical protein
MRLLKLIFVIFFLGACQKASSDTDPLELRIYDPPKGTVRALVNTLNGTMWFSESKVAGRCSITPDGRLAVLATREVQNGAQALVDEVIKHPPPRDQTDAAIDLHYWVLLGRPDPTKPAPPSELTEIAPALAEITRAAGPQAFTVAQRARLLSLQNEKAVVRADRLEVHQTAVRTMEDTFATVELSYFGADKIETRVHLEPNQIVILGATGQPADSTPGTTLYYVVRAASPADAPHP